MSTISIRRGSEGPRHDPYSFTEIIVTRDSPWFTGKVTYHVGLDEWVRVDANNIDRTESRETFRRLAGITPEAAQKAAREFRDRRVRYHPCGPKHLHWVSGYPGEELLHCDQCNNIIDSSFDLSAVE